MEVGHTAAVRGADVQCVIPQGVCHLVEELCNFLVRLVVHAVQYLLDQVWLVSAAGFHDQLTGGGALNAGLSAEIRKPWTGLTVLTSSSAMLFDN